MIICKRCSLEAEPHKNHPSLCEACVHAEDSRLSFYRQHNYNWMEAAEEACIEVWERQPEETDREYEVWLAYRDAYPGIKPSYRIVADQLATTINVVKKVGMRWSFPARLQAWAKHIDALTMRQREKEVLSMNQRHIKMASTLSEKLEKAIELVNPNALDTEDIARLFKLSTEIERKARLDQPVVNTAHLEDNPELKPDIVKQSTMTEIMEVLMKAGQLNNIGVRQTVTTEVVVKNDGDV